MTATNETPPDAERTCPHCGERLNMLGDCRHCIAQALEEIQEERQRQILRAGGRAVSVTVTIPLLGGRHGNWFTANSRLHWAVKTGKVKRIRATAYWLGVSALRTRRLDRPAFDRAHVTAVVHFSRDGRHDPGNASPMVKAAVDGLTDAGFWEDDDSEHVVGPDYRIGEPTGHAGVYRIEIIVEETS